VPTLTRKYSFHPGVRFDRETSLVRTEARADPLSRI